MSESLTVTQLQKALPRGLQQNATQDLVDKINQLSSDEVIREQYRNNMLSYASVMADGRFQIDHYVKAVQYITHKLMGDTNIKAYVKTFPERFEDFKKRGVSDKDIASYVASYNKNKLVNLVREQSLVPTHILNADLYQRAINKQAALMENEDVSFAVQQKAADSLLVNLKPPEAAKIELDVTHKNGSVLDDLRETTLKLAARQQELIKQGLVKPKEIAEAPIQVIDAEEDD